MAEWRLGALLRIFRARYFQWTVGGFSVFWLTAAMYSLMRSGLDARGGFAAAFPSPLRLYPFQIWLEFAAILVATIVMAFTVYPRFAGWLTSAPTIFQYLKRVTGSFVIMILCGWGFGLVMFLIVGFDSPLPKDIPHGQLVAFYEAHWGGMPGAILVHALVTLLVSPLLVAEFLITAVWFLSFGWLVLSTVIMIFIRVSQFILFRVVASSKGPVLGLSGLLVGLGAVVKALKP